LKEHEGGVRVVLGKYRANEIDDCRWDVWNIFGREQYVVEWWKVFIGDVWDGVADLMSY
jgi:hypothetical protein